MRQIIRDLTLLNDSALILIFIEMRFLPKKPYVLGNLLRFQVFACHRICGLIASTNN
jgi:hypothetical protein